MGHIRVRSRAGWLHRREEIGEFHQDLFSSLGIEAENKARHAWWPASRAGMRLGVGFGEEEGEWRFEGYLPASSVCLLLQQTWLVDSQGMSAGVGDCRDGVSREEGLRRRSVWSLEMVAERRGKATVTELGLRLGDWIWRSRGSGEDLHLPY